MAEKTNTQIICGVELAPIEQYGEEEKRWYIKDFAERKRIGIYSAYTLQSWKSILSNIQAYKEKKKAV